MTSSDGDVGPASHWSGIRTSSDGDVGPASGIRTIGGVAAPGSGGKEESPATLVMAGCVGWNRAFGKSGIGEVASEDVGHAEKGSFIITFEFRLGKAEECDIIVFAPLSKFVDFTELCLIRAKTVDVVKENAAIGSWMEAVAKRWI